jgi:AraC-like DNA-binding protein
MANYFKYLTHSQENEDWGMYINVAGYAGIPSGSAYPPKGHPLNYEFSWDKGRILHEYQINYITEGEGIIETSQCSYPIKKGSIIIIKPGVWHRYKPLAKTGWQENYIGFNGTIAQQIFGLPFFTTDAPLLNIGYHESIIKAFFEVFNLIRDEKPGYQEMSVGHVMFILGRILSIKKKENFENKSIEHSIQNACIIIRNNLTSNLNVEDLASELNISYSLFRKVFKKYIGLSPAQYHLSLRIQQAQYLLANSNLSIKEISFSLGFCSIYYFSKLFKEKIGMTPGGYRKSVNPQLEDIDN